VSFGGCHPEFISGSRCFIDEKDEMLKQVQHDKKGALAESMTFLAPLKIRGVGEL